MRGGIPNSNRDSFAPFRNLVEPWAEAPKLSAAVEDKTTKKGFNSFSTEGLTGCNWEPKILSPRRIPKACGLHWAFPGLGRKCIGKPLFVQGISLLGDPSISLCSISRVKVCWGNTEKPEPGRCALSGGLVPPRTSRICGQLGEGDMKVPRMMFSGFRFDNYYKKARTS